MEEKPVNTKPEPEPEPEPEPVKLTSEELELVKESQGKCNDWLQKHVLRQHQVNVLKQRQFNF